MKHEPTSDVVQHEFVRRKPPPLPPGKVPLHELIKPLLGPPSSLAAHNSNAEIEEVIQMLNTFDALARERVLAEVLQEYGGDAADYLRSQLDPPPSPQPQTIDDFYDLYPARRDWMNMVYERLGDPEEGLNPAECRFYGRLLTLPEDQRQRAINSVLERYVRVKPKGLLR